MSVRHMPEGLRRAVLTVALLNLGYFGIEFAVALAIGAVSLLADSVDFLEDASVNLLIFFALAWAPATRARVGRVLAALLLVPALALIWALWEKFTAPMPPEPVALSITGLGALAVNLFCAFTLARFRTTGGSLSKAAFLSARNDAIANIAIIVAGIVTATVWQSVWPDVLVGLAIAAINIDAAREVWEAAHDDEADAAA